MNLEVVIIFKEQIPKLYVLAANLSTLGGGGGGGGGGGWGNKGSLLCDTSAKNCKICGLRLPKLQFCGYGIITMAKLIFILILHFELAILFSSQLSWYTFYQDFSDFSNPRKVLETIIS